MKKVMFFLTAFIVLGLFVNAQDSYQIVNRWKGTYLNVQNGLTSSNIQPGWHSAIWYVEPVAGTGDYRIRNKWTNGYLNIQQGLTCSGIQEGWLSARWKFQKVEGTDYFRIQNVWKPNQFINIENGSLACDEIGQGAFSAHWQWVNAGASNSQANNNQNNTQKNVSGGNLSAPQIKEFVDRHNNYRRMVGSPDVTWNNELANVALAWAKHLANTGCELNHSQNSNYGENIAWFSGAGTPLQTVDMWGAEKQYYNGGVISQNSKAGHYTQVIWAKTTQIGCAMVTCPNGSTIVVCNYNPPGNYMGVSPFQK